MRTGKDERDQNLIKPNDIFLIYFTSMVPYYKREIRFVYKVRKVSKDHADVILDFYAEVQPVDFRTLQELVSTGILSTKFQSCSKQGFNLASVTKSDSTFFRNRITKKTDIQELKEKYEKREKWEINNFDKERAEMQTDYNMIYMIKTGLIEKTNISKKSWMN